MIVDDAASIDTDTDRARDLISAAHALLSSERIANEQELLLTTVIEILASGAKVTSEVASQVQQIWPGADVGPLTVDASLHRGVEAGLIHGQDNLVLDQSWALTPAGVAETNATRHWYEEAMSRLASQVAGRATDDFGRISGEQAALWAELLVEVMACGIRRLEAGYEGKVSKRAGGGIAPIGLDGETMFAELRGRSLSSEIMEFLQSCVLAAIDESDPFGNELVSYIATACVLTAVAARRPRAGAGEALGSLAGRRMVLDTPMLVSMLGPTLELSRLQSTIALALKAGTDVIVPKHVLEELLEVVARVERDHIGALTTALANGLNTRIYRATVNEQMLEIFLEAAEEGRYSTWADFRRTAEGLEGACRAWGVTVRVHGNHDPAVVEECRDALTSELERNGSSRADQVIQRDAHSMAMVWRARRRARRAGDNLWPGGWIVTTDRRIASAFVAVDPEDPVPLTLTPGQWATLLTAAVDPPAVRDLVEAAASFVREESMLAIAMKYPPKVALDLARSLSDEAASTTDARIAQLSFDGLLDRAAGHPSISGERLASEVMAKRTKRQAAAASAQRDNWESEERRLREAKRLAEADAEAQRLAVGALATQVSSSGERVGELEQELQDQKTLGQRQATRAVIMTLGLVVLFTAILFGWWWTVLGTALSCAVFWKVSQGWVTNTKTQLGHMLIALVPEGAVLIDLVRSLRG